MTHFSIVASGVHARLTGGPDFGKSAFAKIAADLRTAEGQSPERDSEWQRVNSYIADVLKDAHVLYSKLARLQGDFIGGERDELEKISERVLDLGETLSHFMKAFHSGEASMLKESTFGGSGGGAPAGTPPPSIPAAFEKRPESEFETEVDIEGDDGEFEDFKEEEEEPEKESSEEEQ